MTNIPLNPGVPVSDPVDVVPLFVKDMDLLKSRLRLSGAAAEDALAIIDMAVQKVRVGFFSHLSQFRIDSLLETDSTANPTSREEILRSLAEQTEVKWCRYILMQELPHMFMDGSGHTQTIWNQEGLTREVKPAEKQQVMAKLWSEITSALSQLDSGSLDPSTISTGTIGPKQDQPRPGASIGLGWSRPGDRFGLD